MWLHVSKIEQRKQSEVTFVVIIQEKRLLPYSPTHLNL